MKIPKPPRIHHEKFATLQLKLKAAVVRNPLLKQLKKGPSR